jgi:hypothetical protein
MPRYLKNKEVTKVVNVFQKNYINGKGNGFGDFLRGSIFLLQIAIIYDLKFDVDYRNHTISKFLHKEKDTETDSVINYENVFYVIGDWQPLNEKLYNEFLSYLNSINSETAYFYTNNGPMHPISEFHANFIKKKFLPNEILQIAINNTMNNHNLINKQFHVIHIRTGDRFLICNEIDYEFFEKIEKEINKIIIPENNYLILSDSNELKTLMKNKFPELIIYVNEITHLGECTALSNDADYEYNSTKNTLVDFFIMSKAIHIHGISVYGHGTGFSEYCSKLFRIGYDYTSIKDDKIHASRPCAV